MCTAVLQASAAKLHCCLGAAVSLLLLLLLLVCDTAGVVCRG